MDGNSLGVTSPAGQAGVNADVGSVLAWEGCGCPFCGHPDIPGCCVFALLSAAVLGHDPDGYSKGYEQSRITNI